MTVIGVSSKIGTRLYTPNRLHNLINIEEMNTGTDNNTGTVEIQSKAQADASKAGLKLL